MPNKILNTSVASGPPLRIAFRVQGSEPLAGVLPEKSTVTFTSGVSKPLTGFTPKVTLATPPKGVLYAYDVVLTGKVPGYKGPAGDDLIFEFKFQKVGGGETRHTANALVDYSPDGTPVVAAAVRGSEGSRGPVERGGAGSGGAVSRDLGLLTGFPFQVYDGVGGGGGIPASGGPGVTAAPSASAMVSAQMRAVLGRSTGSGGVAGTLAALDRSFQQVDDDRSSSWVWQPQSYAVQSDIGAGVTGEQASLARLAASVGTEILPLVSALSPLVPEATVNPDEIDAAKVIFAQTWPAFATELATDGGPRIMRAQRLLSDAATQLVNLGMLLGMYAASTTEPIGFDPLTGPWPKPNRQGVVTGDDEANYTNFVIASDRIHLVMNRWVKLYGPEGSVLGNEDRGFLVTLLQRAIEATGEAADDVYAALDSVNLGRDEREVTYVPGTDPSNSGNGPGLLSVEDILSWASEFPQQEATALLQDAGNVGITSIAARAKGLSTAIGYLYAFATNPSPPAAPRRPVGLTHPRVIYALDLLQDALTDVLSNMTAPALQYTPPTTP